MNMIRKWKEHRERARKQQELALVPQYSSHGIATFPVEVWGVIIDHLVLDILGDPRFRCWELPDILRNRLVCRVFRNEVTRSLHQCILFPQLTYLSVTKVWLQRSCCVVHPGHFLHGLVASALCNSAIRPGRSRWRRKSFRIADRIINCTTIAMEIAHSTPHNNTESMRDVMYSFCMAALTSQYCQEYIHRCYFYDDLFYTGYSGDAYLEAALLVACGYQIEDVKRWMVRLTRQGRLYEYRRGSTCTAGMTEENWVRGQRVFCKIAPSSCQCSTRSVITARLESLVLNEKVWEPAGRALAGLYQRRRDINVLCS